MLGNIEGKRRSRWLEMRWSEGFSDSMDMSLSRRQRRIGKPGMLQFVGLQIIGHHLATEQQQQQTFTEQ